MGGRSRRERAHLMEGADFWEDVVGPKMESRGGGELLMGLDAGPRAAGYRHGAKTWRWAKEPILNCEFIPKTYLKPPFPCALFSSQTFRFLRRGREKKGGRLVLAGSGLVMGGEIKLYREKTVAGDGVAMKRAVLILLLPLLFFPRVGEGDRGIPKPRHPPRPTRPEPKFLFKFLFTSCCTH